ncbi:MAG: hypothetical protein CK425_09875 [Parachlamydia sp.]|nr:MAG: hypothetical protein CK425_09875 [Parachlamydia sp.]
MPPPGGVPPQPPPSTPPGSGAPPPTGPSTKKSETLMHEIDAILAANGLSRDSDPSVPQGFKISMHFKHPPEDPNGVLIQTWERLGAKPKDKEDERPSSTCYCIPMEVEIEFTDGRPSVTLPYTFESQEEVPTEAYKTGDNFGEITKKLCATTLAEEKSRRMYIVYLQALALRHLIKSGTNREALHYEEAKQKIESYMQRGEKQGTLMISLTPGIQTSYDRERARHRGLKNRNIRAIGIKIGEKDAEPLILDFDKKVHLVTEEASGKFTKHKKGTAPPGSSKLTSTEKNRRVALVLDSKDKTAVAEQMLAQRVPPTDPKQHAAFEAELKKAGLSSKTVLTQWPDVIEADIELFKEKTKAFMNFPAKFFSFGTVRNYLMESVLKLHGTGRLHSCNNQVKKYLDDVRAGRLEASSKRKPRSQLGKAQRAYAQAAKKNADSEKALNQFKLATLNAQKDAAHQMSLSDFEGLAPDALAAFENEWEATVPNLGPAENLQWITMKSEHSSAAMTMKQLKSKLDTKKNGLKMVYEDFEAKLKELERLQNSMSARNQWLGKIQEDEKIWDAFSDPKHAQTLSKRIFEISKSERKASQQLAKIHRHFQPNPDFLQKINAIV